MKTNTDTGTQFETGTGGGSNTGSSSDSSGIRGKLGGARNKASEAYSSARERTSAVYGSARERASGAKQQTADRIETNPLAAVAGGLALGAVLGALLPRTQREIESLGSVGHKVNDAAREAANTAVETGRQQVTELTSDAVSKVSGAVAKAVMSGDQQQSQSSS